MPQEISVIFWYGFSGFQELLHDPLFYYSNQNKNDIKVLTTEKRLLSKVLNLRIQSHVNYACAILYKLTFLVARLGIVRRRG